MLHSAGADDSLGFPAKIKKNRKKRAGAKRRASVVKLDMFLGEREGFCEQGLYLARQQMARSAAQFRLITCNPGRAHENQILWR